MLTMIAMGAWLGAAIDTYHRLFLSRNGWLLFCSDVLFWLVQGLLIFYVLLQVNEGEIRFYIFIALLCGFAAYRALMQKTYRRLLEAVVRFTVALIRALQKAANAVIVKPLQWLIKLTALLLLSIGKVLWTMAFFILKVHLYPLKWMLQLIWRLLPDPVKNTTKKVAGLIKNVQNKIRNWVKRE